MRRFAGPMKDGMVVLLFLYGGSAILLLNLMDMGIIDAIQSACSLPWLETACWYYSLPAVVFLISFMLWSLLREAITHRKTRRESRQIIAQLKSDAKKEASP